MRLERSRLSELLRVDAVVFVFAAVDEVQVEGMSQDESQTLGLAGIGQPVPAEHAFGADREAVAIGLDELEEVVEVVVFDVAVDQFFALAVHDADIHLVSMQIDSAVELSRGGVIFHLCIQ